MAFSSKLIRCAHYAAVAMILNIISWISPDFLFSYISSTASLILYVLMACFTYDLCKPWYFDEKIQPHKKAVLITGCDSGFGNALAKRLDMGGFHVFASCLFPEGEGAKELKRYCSDRLRTLYLDVTKEESIEKALTFVKQNLGSNVLWAVVNNAGVGVSKGTSTDFSSVEDFKVILDVNALGPVRVTKAFLPLLKESKGRVVNVTSLAARIPCPEANPYVMSKYAALAFTQCLSLEMEVWGVRAISIEPDLFRTPMTNPDLTKKRLEDEARKAPEDILTSYGEDYLTKRTASLCKMLGYACEDINPVVDCLEAAVTDKDPEYSYMACRNFFFRVCAYIAASVPFEIFEPCQIFLAKIHGYPVPKMCK